MASVSCLACVTCRERAKLVKAKLRFTLHSQRKRFRWAMFLFLATQVVVGCPKKSSKSGIDSDDANRPGFEPRYSNQEFSQLEEHQQFQAYVSACEKRLGKIPRIRCDQGTEIPAGETTHSVFENFDGAKTQYATGAAENRVCDRPSIGLSHNLAHAACTPHSRMGRAAPEQGFNTEWVYLCRRFFDRGKNSPLFDDISQIGYDRTTGATCFFVTKVNEERPQSRTDDKAINAKQLPDFHSAESLKSFMSPKEMSRSLNCLECHTSHAWIRTPQVTQVSAGGKRILPEVGKNDPYHVVAFNYLEAVGDQSWRPVHLVSPEAKTCTGCHRIGGRFYSSYLVPAAFGMTPNLLIDGKKAELPRFSAHANQFPTNLHFDLGRSLFPLPRTPEEWNKSPFKKSAEFISECESQNITNCQWLE